MVGTCIITHSCQYCKTLFLDLSGRKLYFDSPIHVKLLDQANLENDRYFSCNGPSIRHATLAANNGCQFFQFIIGQIDTDKVFPDDGIELWFKIKGSGLEGKDHFRSFVNVHVVSRDGGTRWDTQRQSDTSPNFDFPWLLQRFCWFRFFCLQPEFQVFIERDDPAYSLIQVVDGAKLRSETLDLAQRLEKDTQPPKTNFEAGIAFETARSWLQKCQKEHPNCLLSNKLDRHVLQRPKRLLQIFLQYPNKVRLVPDRGKPYAALSYCWGLTGTQALMLTRTTRSRLLQGCTISSLSQSAQDALLVTRKLGLWYLWVDALCILQDDPAEQFIELGKMAYIYFQAEVTIAAGNSSSSQDGFLSSAHQTTPTFNLGVKVAYGGGPDGSVILQPVCCGRPKQEMLGTPPLHSRGWTLQEWVFSRRYLHYGVEDLEWRCQTISEDDGSCELLRMNIFTYNFTHFIPGNDPSGTLNGWRALEAWWDVVPEYSRRGIGQSPDKLNAVASIAEIFGAYMNCRYLAGLWSFENLLKFQLSWRLETDLRRLEYPGQTGSWPPKKLPPPVLPRPLYRAPSWSWASVDGRAIFTEPNWILDERRAAVHVIDCNTKPVSSLAPYAAVASGYIVLEGPMRRVPLYSIDQQQWTLRIQDTEYGVDLVDYLDAESPEVPANGDKNSEHELWLLRAITAPRTLEDMNYMERPFAKEHGEYPRSKALVLFRPNSYQPFVRRALLEYVSRDRFEWEDLFTYQRARVI